MVIAPREFAGHVARRALARWSGNDALLGHDHDRFDPERSVLDALPLGVGYLDTDRRFRFVNASYAEIHHRAPTDFVGRHIADMLGPARYHGIRVHLDTAFAGTRATVDVVSTDDAGDVAHQLVHYVPDPAVDGKIRGVIVLVN